MKRPGLILTFWCGTPLTTCSKADEALYRLSVGDSNELNREEVEPLVHVFGERSLECNANCTDKQKTNVWRFLDFSERDIG